MGFFSKLILTGIGWAIGGPIGAIIGYAIGALFSSDGIKPIGDGGYGDDSDDAGSYGGGYSSSQQTHNKTRTTPADFRAALLVLVACVMKADGHVRRSELDVVKSFLLRNFGEEDGKEALQLLKRILEQDIDVNAVAQQVSRNVNYSTKLEIIHLLLDVAHADSVIDNAELAMITRIANIFLLTDADLQSLLALYGKGKDPDWAYKALEIERSATDDEVKKAYRRMAMKYHPDKVASAGDEAKQAATEKFRAINEAYEEIKAVRGIK